jgi:hypothetical protein
MDEQITLLGIRHHGPGCAYSIRAALQELQPDVILLEGAEELQDSWALMAHAGMKPPVAQLVFNPKDPKDSVIYPWAEFSPEWQAMAWASEQQIELRMIDLPVGMRDSSEDEHADQTDTADSEDSVSDTQDHSLDTFPHLPNSSQMLDLVTRAAGFSDHEVWWDANIERHSGSLAMFEALAELMREARKEYEQVIDNIIFLSNEQKQHLLHEQRREAWMRKQIRLASKSFGRIVVICGAWHVPALSAKVAVKDDNAILKGLKRKKMDVAWTLYNFQRLSQHSGYGAGVIAPEWYDHLYQHHRLESDSEQLTIQWLIKTAELLRKQGYDCSSAHVIEAVRLALSLAQLRGFQNPGLEEMLDATRSIMTEGSQVKIEQIYDQLAIGERIGALPEDAPNLPIEQDFLAIIKTLRLKQLDSQEELALDLRKEIGLQRSQLFRRLNVLNIPWARERRNSSKGTFKETWLLRWEPEFSIHLIDASLLGNTIESASRCRLTERINSSHQVQTIVDDIHQLLLCNLLDAIPEAVKHLRDVAALSADTQDMMTSLMPLVQLMRYGSVRQFDSQSLSEVADSIIIRACNGLTSASAGLDEDASLQILKAIENMHSAIRLYDQPEHNQRWLAALKNLSICEGVHALLRGRSSRMLHEQTAISDEEMNQRFRLNVSASQDAEAAASWVEGMLMNASASLLFDDTLFGLLDGWLTQLTEEDFVQTLPLVRRAFSTFDGHAINQLSQRIANQSTSQPMTDMRYDDDLASRAVNTVIELLGLSPNQSCLSGERS